MILECSLLRLLLLGKARPEAAKRLAMSYVAKLQFTKTTRARQRVQKPAWSASVLVQQMQPTKTLNRLVVMYISSALVPLLVSSSRSQRLLSRICTKQIPQRRQRYCLVLGHCPERCKLYLSFRPHLLHCHHHAGRAKATQDCHCRQ